MAGSDRPGDLEVHVLDQVLEVDLVLVRREGQRVTVGDVQVHGVLQRGGAPLPGDVQQGPEARGYHLQVRDRRSWGKRLAPSSVGVGSQFPVFTTMGG